MGLPMAVAPLFSNAPPGNAKWRAQHGDKTAFPFCLALRHLRATALHDHNSHGRRVGVYHCTLGPAVDAPPEQRRHWHVGHFWPGKELRPMVTLAS